MQAGSRRGPDLQDGARGCEAGTRPPQLIKHGAQRCEAGKMPPQESCAWPSASLRSRQEAAAG